MRHLLNCAATARLCDGVCMQQHHSVAFCALQAMTACTLSGGCLQVGTSMMVAPGTLTMPLTSFLISSRGARACTPPKAVALLPPPLARPTTAACAPHVGACQAWDREHHTGCEQTSQSLAPASRLPTPHPTSTLCTTDCQRVCWYSGLQAVQEGLACSPMRAGAEAGPLGGPGTGGDERTAARDRAGQCGSTSSAQ